MKRSNAVGSNCSVSSRRLEGPSTEVERANAEPCPKVRPTSLLTTSFAQCPTSSASFVVLIWQRGVNNYIKTAVFVLNIFYKNIKISADQLLPPSFIFQYVCVFYYLDNVIKTLAHSQFSYFLYRRTLYNSFTNNNEHLNSRQGVILKRWIQPTNIIVWS